MILIAIRQAHEEPHRLESCEASIQSSTPTFSTAFISMIYMSRLQESRCICMFLPSVLSRELRPKRKPFACILPPRVNTAVTPGKQENSAVRCAQPRDRRAAATAGANLSFARIRCLYLWIA